MPFELSFVELLLRSEGMDYSSEFCRKRELPFVVGHCVCALMKSF